MKLQGVESGRVAKALDMTCLFYYYLLQGILLTAYTMDVCTSKLDLEATYTKLPSIDFKVHITSPGLTIRV
ncbi:hypothetical protein BJX61DRAFT_240055 [Aspergillus egyptiacus]|nr:hypothetical protein BJX61DRAFT_240055 [Aspergillus egyptiacus]